MKAGPGHFRLHHLRGQRWEPAGPPLANQVQYLAGFLAYQLYGRGQTQYRLSTMYLEFANVVTPGDTVTPPTFSQGDQLEYYQGLRYGVVGAFDADYLRVRTLGDPELDIAAGLEAYFTPGVTGNQVTWRAQSGGSPTGMHGVLFDSSVNSLVYGLALVASPVPGDATQDIVFARAYYDPADQVPKEPGSIQVGVSYRRQFS